MQAPTEPRGWVRRLPGVEQRVAEVGSVSEEKTTIDRYFRFESNRVGMILLQEWNYRIPALYNHFSGDYC